MDKPRIWLNYDLIIFIVQNEQPYRIEGAWLTELDVLNSVAELSGNWPVAERLSHLKNGDTIEIVNDPVGRYYEEDVIMRLTNCRVSSKKFHYPAIGAGPWGDNCEGPVIINLTVDCDVELLVPERMR